MLQFQSRSRQSDAHEEICNGGLSHFSAQISQHTTLIRNLSAKRFNSYKQRWKSQEKSLHNIQLFTAKSSNSNRRFYRRVRLIVCDFKILKGIVENCIWPSTYLKLRQRKRFSLHLLSRLFNMVDVQMNIAAGPNKLSW